MSQERMDLSTAVSALNAAPCAVLVVDNSNQVRFANQLANILLSDGQKSLMGLTLDRLPVPLTERWYETETLVTFATHDGVEKFLRTQRVTLANTPLQALYLWDVTELQKVSHERERLAEELTRLSTRDALTSLPNDKAMNQALEPLVSRSRRYENPLSVIRVRISEPEQLNAAHGPNSHDLAMVRIAQLLRDQVRWADLVGRFDTNEFLLILPETPAEAAHNLAEKLAQRLVEMDITGEKAPFRITPALGVASWQKGEDARTLLKRAASNLRAATEGKAA